MDDRHTYSEPRPALGHGKPTWEVDVYRNGVDDPVFTLHVDEDSLPPRMRKKKVVWKLPDHQDTLPHFGADEKRRLVELFKEQKKNRRKSKRFSQSGSDIVDDSSEKTQKDDASTGKREEEGDKEKKKDFSMSGLIPAPPGLQRLPEANGYAKGSPVPPPGLGPIPTGETSPSTASTQGEPATMPSISDSPPPGFISTSPNECSFSVPTSSSNIPVDLAQLFMDVYYCSMTHGQQEDLLMHYVGEGAVKSLSLGGAHSFCKTKNEILVQLNSLQGSVWDVGGVVAQEGFEGSVVLLLTGTCLPKTSTQPIPFCHTITLVQKQPYCYQIHNDAMSLMTLT